ncbi:Aminoacylase-1 [Smittium mucronatum]|uniref:N-acyl-aliphatic-L-amino acid amidohydrolase n=1 Tax=Smittium mucronatum TaxID=133383 RepID=A0A1R0GY84_9FUNG|nr:Aminoacylase-1 [Smittium mucronatum]
MTVPEPISVTRFRQYLKINTMHPEPDYYKCAEFLVDQAKEIGLESSIVECVKGKPIVIMKLLGTEPTEKALMLSSHVDVVPIFEDQWTHPPFAADRVETEDGDFKIFARGAQDMKNQGSMYLEAIRKIVSSGKKLKRNVILAFCPDEEIGSVDGAKMFVETPEFADLNIGFDIDESASIPAKISGVIYAERANGQVTFTANGNTGHGSQFIQGTAIEKMLPVINYMMNLRAECKAKYDSVDPRYRLIKSGDSTTINLTQVEGGTQPNVVPAFYSVTFDIRVTPHEDINEFRKKITDMATSFGVETRFHRPDEFSSLTKIDKSNVFIGTFYKSLEKQQINYIDIVFPANTDARYIRTKGIPAFGFNPMQGTPVLAHDFDEFVFESEFLKGIDVYATLIQDLADC